MTINKFLDFWNLGKVYETWVLHMSIIFQILSLILDYFQIDEAISTTTSLAWKLGIAENSDDRFTFTALPKKFDYSI